jgi:putative transposase
MQTILEEYTRECHVLWAGRALKPADVLHWLQKAVQQHVAPEYLRSDNGSEFIANIVQRSLKRKGIKTIYIEPGSLCDAEWRHSRLRSGMDKHTAKT